MNKLKKKQPSKKYKRKSIAEIDVLGQAIIIRNSSISETKTYFQSQKISWVVF